MLQCPQSLLARVYKAKYFPHTSLLEVTVGHNPSYSWRSLTWGRDLLLTGLRWKVGNGRDINIFSSQWLPRPSTFRPITAAGSGQDGW